MGKSNDSAAVVAAVGVPVAATAADTFAVSLDEFCQRLSVKKVSSELIGGFYHSQSVVGNVKGSDANFTAAFAAFVNQPA